MEDPERLHETSAQEDDERSDHEGGGALQEMAVRTQNGVYITLHDYQTVSPMTKQQSALP
jgi:hypothetical protein